MSRKIFVLAVAFLLLQNSSYSANWQELQTPNKKAYIDLDSIVIKLPKLYYKVKYQKGDSYYIFDFISNYNDKTSKIFSVDKYENGGKFVASSQKEENHIMNCMCDTEKGKEGDIQSIEIQPNSINEVAYNQICSIIKANDEKMEQLKNALVPIKIKKDAVLEFIDANTVTIDIQLQNTQNKDIKEFTGDIEVYDVSKNKIAKLNINGNNVKKQSKRTLYYSWSTWDSSNNRQMLEIHRRCNSNLIFVFTPTKIIFDDGTRL